MRKSLYFLLCTAALASLAGCNKFDETDTAPEPGNGSLIKVYAVNPGDNGTRANINVGESTFTAEWEAEDALGILPVKDGAAAPSEAAAFTYNTADAAFSGTLKDFASGGGKYYAFHPHAKVTGTTANIPFGNLRTQAGNDFNSEFDALVAEPAAYADTDTEPGKIDGKPVTFTLHRLTSILNFSIGGSKTDKVKYLLLTSGTETQKLSASSLDFSLENGSAATAPTLNTADQSNVIAVGYEAGSEPAANAVDALINVPAGNYDNLTLDVITEDKQIGSVTVQRNDAGNPFVAGTLYKKEIADMTFSTIAAPSLVWPDQDMDEVHDITKCGTDYQANIKINVPGGISNLVVNVSSEILNSIGVNKLNLFTDKVLSENLPVSYEDDLGLSCSTKIQYKKSIDFNITLLIPLIESIGAPAGSMHIFEVVVTDLAGQITTQELKFQMPAKVTLDKADLWANTASLTIKDIDTNAQTVSLQYRIKNEATWNTAEVSAANADGTRTATIKPTWTENTNESGHTIYTADSKTGIFAKKTYEYQLSVDGAVVESNEFTPINNNGDSIPGFSSDSSCFTTKNTTSTTWGSGNNTFAQSLCTYDGTTSAAYMQAKNPGIGSIQLAPGNLFTGTFTFNGIFSQTGTVDFGQAFTYTARPTALKLYYKATIGTVTAPGSQTYINEGDQDQASIVVCITDWNDRHSTTAGKGTPTGVWNPATKDGLGSEEKIIAYGIEYPSETVTEMRELIIPLNYYDTTSSAPTGKYTIVISCATSRYGDYLNGCADNSLYVKDFQWVY